MKNLRTLGHSDTRTLGHSDIQHSGIRRRAFTLVELVVVIAIIAAVAAILLPTIGKIKREVQKVQDVSHLKKIRDAWYTYVYDFGIRVSTFGGVNHYSALFADRLAGLDQKDKSMIILNDAAVYCSPGDKYCSHVSGGAIGSAICKFAGDTIIRIDPEPWDNKDRGLGKVIVHSYCIIGNLPAGSPPETTPLAFTRGLCADGTWHDKYGLYGESGGYVIYCDGHVKWFDGKRSARFLKWDQSGYTTDIREAVPNTTRIICGGNGITTNIKNKNDSLMFTNHAGTGGAE